MKHMTEMKKKRYRYNLVINELDIDIVCIDEEGFSIIDIQHIPFLVENYENIFGTGVQYYINMIRRRHNLETLINDI